MTTTCPTCRDRLQQRVHLAVRGLPLFAESYACGSVWLYGALELDVRGVVAWLEARAAEHHPEAAAEARECRKLARKLIAPPPEGPDPFPSGGQCLRVCGEDDGTGQA